MVDGHCVWVLQSPARFVSEAFGRTSLALYATNCCFRARLVGRKVDLSAGPLPSGSAATGIGVVSLSASARAAYLSRVGRWPLRPVLKHGPRSLTYVRVIEWSKLKGVVKAKACVSG